MSSAQHTFQFAPRPILKLCYVLDVIKKSGLIRPVPSRPKLVALIEEGKIEGYKNEDLNCYVVFEDSLNDWIRRQTTAHLLLRN